MAHEEKDVVEAGEVQPTVRGDIPIDGQFVGARQWASEEFEIDRRGIGIFGTYVYGEGNRVTQAGDRGYRYDAAGQLTASPDADYRYDAKGRIVEGVRKDGTRLRYRYDYTGRRVVKESEGSGGRLRAIYVDRLSEERDGQLIDYVYVGDQRIARLGGKKPGAAVQRAIAALPPVLQGFGLLLMLAAAVFAGPRVLRSNARRAMAMGLACAVAGLACGGCPAPPVDGTAVFYHSDVLGGVALQTDSEGKPVGERAYSPYGTELVGSDEPYGFTGKELDAELGLHHFGARAYDAYSGRFVSPDPAVLANPELALGDSQLLSPYAYARNSPHSYTDPDGQVAQVVAGAGLGALVGGGVYLAKAAFTGGFTWKGLGGAILGGAVSGGIAGLTMGASLVVQVGVGAGAGVAGGLASRGVETGSLTQMLDPKAIAVDAALGGVAGPIASKVVGAIASKAAPVVKDLFAKAKAVVGKGAAKGGQKLLPANAGPTAHISPSEVVGKTTAQIDARARELGLQPRGQDPASGRGAYVDPQTGQQRILSIRTRVLRTAT